MQSKPQLPLPLPLAAPPPLVTPQVSFVTPRLSARQSSRQHMMPSSSAVFSSSSETNATAMNIASPSISPAHAIGARVLVRRADGDEAVAFIDAFDARSGVYRVALGAADSGVYHVAALHDIRSDVLMTPRLDRDDSSSGLRT